MLADDSIGLCDKESMIGLIEELAISKLKPSRNSIRSSDMDIEPLALSIRQKGLLQPILVRPTEDGNFEVIAGNRRYNACKLLHWRKVRCHIVDLDDKSAYEVSLIENVQRRSMNPVEEAEAYKKYIEEFGWGSASDLARRIGKSKSHISKRIALLKLPKEVLEKLASREIAPSLAEELCRFENQEDQSKLAQLVAQRHLSMRRIRSLSMSDGLERSDASMLSLSNTGPDPIQVTDRAFEKTIVSLKVALSNIGSLIETVEDDWIGYELLMEHKNKLHSQVDVLLKEKKRLLNKRRTLVHP